MITIWTELSKPLPLYQQSHMRSFIFKYLVTECLVKLDLPLQEWLHVVLKHSSSGTTKCSLFRGILWHDWSLEINSRLSDVFQEVFGSGFGDWISIQAKRLMGQLRTRRIYEISFASHLKYAVSPILSQGIMKSLVQYSLIVADCIILPDSNTSLGPVTLCTLIKSQPSVTIQ